MKRKKDKRSAYQKEVDRLYERLANIEDQGSDEYKAVLETLKTLTEVECEKLRSKPRKDYYEILKPFVVGLVGLLQIGSIMAYEERNLLHKKALDFVLRGRV